eukprot:8179106-Prorocentrum_lima.AAC.1
MDVRGHGLGARGHRPHLHPAQYVACGASDKTALPPLHHGYQGGLRPTEGCSRDVFRLQTGLRRPEA